jgi:hypothetical protein
MKPDSMIVDPEHIVKALQKVAPHPQRSLARFQQQEPALAAFIGDQLSALAGRLALAGAPTDVVQTAHAEALRVVLGSVEALRRGHYDLWKDTTFGQRLRPRKTPRPRRPKPPQDEPDCDIPF